MLLKKIVTLLLFLSVIIAQDKNPLLNDVQEKYKTVKNFTADFKQEGDAGQLEGKFYFAKGNKLRIELEERLIVTDGVTIWTYHSAANRVIINSFEDNPTSLSLEKYLFEYTDKCTVSTGKSENGMDKLVLIPGSGELDFKKAELTINPDKLVEKIKLVDLIDNRFIFQLSNIRINQSLSNSLFTYNIPEGVQTIDLR